MPPKNAGIGQYVKWCIAHKLRDRTKIADVRAPNMIVSAGNWNKRVTNLQKANYCRYDQTMLNSTFVPNLWH